MTRDDFDDSDQLRIGNDGIFMLTFFSKYMVQLIFVSQQPKIAIFTLRFMRHQKENCAKVFLGFFFLRFLCLFFFFPWNIKMT